MSKKHSVCFDCSCLGDCPFAGKVNKCDFYVSAIITQKTISQVTAIPFGTVKSFCKDSYGIKKLVFAMRESGYQIVIDREDGRISFYQKIRFKERKQQVHMHIDKENAKAIISIQKI